jgi:hypothetical protein
MNAFSGLIIGMIGFTSTVAAVTISAIIVLVLSQIGVLAFRKVAAHS